MVLVANKCQIKRPIIARISRIGMVKLFSMLKTYRESYLMEDC